MEQQEEEERGLGGGRSRGRDRDRAWWFCLMGAKEWGSSSSSNVHYLLHTASLLSFP